LNRPHLILFRVGNFRVSDSLEAEHKSTRAHARRGTACAFCDCRWGCIFAPGGGLKWVAIWRSVKIPRLALPFPFPFPNNRGNSLRNGEPRGWVQSQRVGGDSRSGFALPRPQRSSKCEPPRSNQNPAAPRNFSSSVRHRRGLPFSCPLPAFPTPLASFSPCQVHLPAICMVSRAHRTHGKRV
jgi:hypothetical protein